MYQMRPKPTLEYYLVDFPSDCARPAPLARDGGSVSFWLPSDVKARYRALQIKSGHRFGKRVREAIIAMVELAEEREP